MKKIITKAKMNEVNKVNEGERKEQINSWMMEEQELRVSGNWTDTNKKRREELLELLKNNPWHVDWEAPSCSLTLTKSTTVYDGVVAHSVTAGQNPIDQHRGHDLS